MAHRLPFDEHMSSSPWALSPSVSGSAWVVRTEPGSPAAASYRQLRAWLRRHGDPRIIALSGFYLRAGTSRAAVNLAFTLAEGRPCRVALVDGNLENPMLANLLAAHPRGLREPRFGAPAEVPTSDDRLATLPWRLASARTDEPLVASLPFGERPRLYLPRASATLAALPSLLSLLHDHYDRVVIDLAPRTTRLPAAEIVLAVALAADGRLRFRALPASCER